MPVLEWRLAKVSAAVTTAVTKGYALVAKGGDEIPATVRRTVRFSLKTVRKMADSDGDGNPIFGCPEVAYGETDNSPNPLGSAIYLETLRTREYPTENTHLWPLSPARSAAHEIGHMFGGFHSDGGLMAPSCGAATVLSGYVLTPHTIAMLRRDILNP